MRKLYTFDYTHAEKCAAADSSDPFMRDRTLSQIRRGWHPPVVQTTEEKIEMEDGTKEKRLRHRIQKSAMPGTLPTSISGVDRGTTSRQAEINKKRTACMPSNPSRRMDARTAREVEETRRMKRT